jgi:hypothetical protein
MTIPHPALARNLLGFGTVLVIKPDADEHRKELARLARVAEGENFPAGPLYAQALAGLDRNRTDPDRRAQWLLIVAAIEVLLRQEAALERPHPSTLTIAGDPDVDRLSGQTHE